MTVFNPTIEAVTFHFRGCCMLGMFLLTAFTRLGHECQDLLSPCDGMHVCTHQTSVYTLIRKSFRGMELELMLAPREKSPLPEKSSSEKDRTHDAASRRTASPTLYQLNSSGPRSENEVGYLSFPQILTCKKKKKKETSSVPVISVCKRLVSFGKCFPKENVFVTL